MLTVLCGIDESGSPEAVSAAINYCRQNHADLRLIGFVKEKLSDTTTVIAGERVRRSKTVRLELNRAADAARAAGVTVSTSVRAGNDMRGQLLRAAEANGSAEVFYVRTRGPIQAAFTHEPRREVVGTSVGTPTDHELAAAA
ncbi:MAG TPA: hypothetical protein VFW80_11175 [Gaiellaceae bacterium]|nr:hypothetical protein [Gaiellaceae bacterium]